MCDRTNWPDEAVLLADLQATYPGMSARPLKEFGLAGYDYGVWTGGGACMPDGYEIFCSTSPDFDIYNGRVHHGFEEWLRLRGWFVEDYDGATFLIRCHAQDDADWAKVHQSYSPVGI